MPEFQQVNVNLSHTDVHKMDVMISEDGIYFRSAFVRKLIRDEYARRYPNVIQQTIKIQESKE